MYRHLASLMDDLEVESAITRDVVNEARIANGFRDHDVARAAISRLRIRIADMAGLWTQIMHEFDTLGVRPAA